MEKALHKLLATLLFVSLGITTGWAHAVNKQTVEADNPVQPEEEVQTVDLPYSVAFDEDPTVEGGWTVVDNSMQAGTTWTYGSYTTFEGSRLGMGMQADYGGGPNGAGPLTRQAETSFLSMVQTSITFLHSHSLLRHRRTVTDIILTTSSSLPFLRTVCTISLSTPRPLKAAIMLIHTYSTLLYQRSPRK